MRQLNSHTVWETFRCLLYALFKKLRYISICEREHIHFLYCVSPSLSQHSVCCAIQSYQSQSLADKNVRDVTLIKLHASLNIFPAIFCFFLDDLEENKEWKCSVSVVFLISDLKLNQCDNMGSSISWKAPYLPNQNSRKFCAWAFFPSLVSLVHR